MTVIEAGLTPTNGPAGVRNRGTLIIAGLLAALALGGAALLASGNPPWRTRDARHGAPGECAIARNAGRLAWPRSRPAGVLGRP